MRLTRPVTFRLLGLSLAMLVGLAAAAAIARPATSATVTRKLETTQAYGIRATLAYVETTTVVGTYTVKGKPKPVTFTTYSDLRASVFQGGRLLTSQLLGHLLGPGNVGRGKSIAIRRLIPSGRPDVVVDIYSGGAHCCFSTEIYVLSPTGIGARINHDWGSSGYGLVDLKRSGTFEFESGDDRFAYAFTDYADSADPIQIWDLQGDRLVDTTRSYPQAITADAKRLLQEYMHARSSGDVRGILSAYVADEAMLGTPNTGWNLVNTALARGDLDQGVGGAHGNQYVAALRHFLTAKGYG